MFIGKRPETALSMHIRRAAAHCPKASTTRRSSCERPMNPGARAPARRLSASTKNRWKKRRINMIRKILTATIAAGALAIAGPAIAGPGGGHGGNGGGHGGGVGAGANANAGAHMGGAGQGGLNAGVNANLGGKVTTNTNDSGVLNSQGLLHASPNGIAHASPNSVLARGAVPGTSLTGLTNGLTVMNSGGTTIGTVSQVVTDTNGNIRLVIVTSPTGQMLRLAPSTLSISGGVVTTTAM
jgi:hypothetical protein